MKRTISEDQAGVAGGGEPPAGAPEAARRPLRELMDDRLLDALLERSRDQAGGLRLTGEGSMLGELVRAVLERALESELTAHLGYAKGGRGGQDGNARNGSIGKTVQTGVGPVPLQVPRDRAASFEPVLVPKRAGRVAGGLDDMVISLYAHGMSNRDIIHHLRQVYGTDLSPSTVSAITDAVLEEVKAWQSRPLDPAYAVVFLDARHTDTCPAFNHLEPAFRRIEQAAIDQDWPALPRSMRSQHWKTPMWGPRLRTRTQ